MSKISEAKKALDEALAAYVPLRNAWMNADKEYNRLFNTQRERDNLAKDIYARYPIGGYQSALKQANEFILGKYGEEID